VGTLAQVITEQIVETKYLVIAIYRHYERVPGDQLPQLLLNPGVAGHEVELFGPESSQLRKNE
jgi:hypothetical protein